MLLNQGIEAKNWFMDSDSPVAAVRQDEALRKLLIRALELIAADPDIADFTKAYEILRRHLVWHSGVHDVELAVAFYEAMTAIAKRERLAAPC